jgi:hypothetical protein
MVTIRKYDGDSTTIRCDNTTVRRTVTIVLSHCHNHTVMFRAFRSRRKRAGPNGTLIFVCRVFGNTEITILKVKTNLWRSVYTAIQHLVLRPLYIVHFDVFCNYFLYNQQKQ